MIEDGWFFRPMQTIRPAGHASCTACSKEEGIHTVSTTTGIPSPSVKSNRRCSKLSSETNTVSSAPIDFAFSRRSFTRSVMITSAPFLFATCIAAIPIGPEPIIRTLSPFVICPRLLISTPIVNGSTRPSKDSSKSLWNL